MEDVLYTVSRAHGVLHSADAAAVTAAVRNVKALASRAADTIGFDQLGTHYALHKHTKNV